MSHVNDMAMVMRAELARIYPAIPRCLDVGDEYAGDFGLAHYLGLRDGCARLTFDEGRMPSRKMVAHELWHAAHENAGETPFTARPTDRVLRGFWLAMGYRIPYDSALAICEQKVMELGPNNAWGWYPGEQMAEAFGYVVARLRASAATAMWTRYGGYFNDRVPYLEAFFRSVRPAPPTSPEEEEMTKEQFEVWFLEMTRKHIAPSERAIKDLLNDHAHIVSGNVTTRVVENLGNEPE